MSLNLVIKKEKTFTSSIFLGLQSGYSNEMIPKGDVYGFISKYQEDLIAEKEIQLSATVTETDVVFAGQIEPHLKINFINYPKFPVKIEVFKSEIECFAMALMERFKQNRLVIEFTDETLMFEASEKLDPRIFRK